MNKVILKGNLVRDPEVKELDLSGDRSTSVANFTIAVNRRYTKTDGDKKEQTEFIDCEAWDKGAELIGKLLSKGDPVLLEGSIKTDKWEKDGTYHSRTRVRVEQFDKLGRYRSTSDEPDEPTETSSKEENLDTVAVADGDDIPF